MSTLARFIKKTPFKTSYAAALLIPGLLIAAPMIRSDLNETDHARVKAITAPTTQFDNAERFEGLPAGATTVRDKAVNRDIFSHPSANLSFEARERFFVGNGLFRKDWVSSPSSTQASDGLGPLFNARSCQGCHIKDGRGVVPVDGEEAVSLFLRLSVPAKTEAQKQLIASHKQLVIAEPTYGTQLQNFAVPGLSAEGRMQISWEEIPVKLNGGETVSLRKPTYSIADLGFGPMQKDVMISPRIASPMLGLGLLEAIHEDDILANANRQHDPDGIKGKANLVYDIESDKVVIGRFGWKAGQPTVKQQGAHAFAGDMGLSTPMLPSHYGDCSAKQKDCLELPHGAQAQFGKEEVPGELMDLVAFYSENLAVPSRPNSSDKQVLAGKKEFYEARCQTCHTPKYVTRRDAKNPELRFQLIWPYTDLLLHDMGEGLADHMPEGLASGLEWKTPPLWGIGLATTVNERATFLHDGRARTILEAVLWHGGEAQNARDRVVAMTPEQRANLIRFIESL